LFLSVPEHITNEYYNFIAGNDNYQTNDVFVNKREILFSITLLKNTTPVTASNYLMCYNIDTKALTKKNISSFGETVEYSGGYGKIHSIYNEDNNLLISSSEYDATGDTIDFAIESIEYNIDATNTTSKIPYVYDNYEPYIITGLISVGDVYNKKTFRTLNISLLRALGTGQGIKVSYREDDNSSWTLIKTIDFTK
jgi:hypothetical protein